jgi:hypothetical protein
MMFLPSYVAKSRIRPIGMDPRETVPVAPFPDTGEASQCQYGGVSICSAMRIALTIT